MPYMQQLSNLAFKSIRCSDAREFLSVLSPANMLWGLEPGDWVFRGHRDSNWLLLPSALRPGELKDITRQPILAAPAPVGIMEERLAKALILTEFQQVKSYFELCDDHGLPIPGDSHEHRTFEGIIGLGRHLASVLTAKDAPANLPVWPSGPWLYVYALAQHYGIRTRLLDWTKKPKVAAYFATRDVAKEMLEGQHDLGTAQNKQLCVWAINRKKLLSLYTLIFPEPPDCPHLRFITAPQASNPNLNAQGGLFTVDLNARRRIPLNQLILDSLAKVADKDTSLLREADPFLLAKVELPYLHARPLLKLLARESVSAASVYPGYQGAAMALEERGFVD